MDRSRIAIVIPAFNESSTIFDVVKAASEYGHAIVVDDGSSDDTTELAGKAGAIVVSHLNNQGYDAALNTGFAASVSHGYEWIITLDADGQHDPTLLQKFATELAEGADLVLGVRNAMPRVAESLFAFYARIRYGVLDPLCGMKAYRRNVYESLGHFDSYRSIGTELALHAARNKFIIRQVKFKVKERYGQPRFGRVFEANIRILRAMVVDILKTLR